MARLGPVLIRSLKHSHDVPRDSFSFCLKDRTSKRRLTTLEMGKNCKQKLEHKAFQSPCVLSMVSLYQYLAFPVKEKGKSFYRNISSDMPVIHRHAQVCSTHLGGNKDFHHLNSERIDPGPCLLNTGAAHSKVLG